ncbi:fructose-bisphosphatase class III, partial [Porphyromonas gulae]
IKSITVVREVTSHRMLVKDTDNGRLLSKQVENLKKLLQAYSYGLIKERKK